MAITLPLMHDIPQKACLRQSPLGFYNWLFRVAVSPENTAIAALRPYPCFKSPFLTKPQGHIRVSIKHPLPFKVIRNNICWVSAGQRSPSLLAASQNPSPPVHLIVQETPGQWVVVADSELYITCVSIGKKHMAYLHVHLVPHTVSI